MSAQVVAAVGELSAGQAKAATVVNGTGQQVSLALICDTRGTLYAIDEMCTHGEVPLSEGEVGEAEIECWAHCAVFNLKTGQGTLPATEPVNTYPVTVDGSNVLVDVDA